MVVRWAADILQIGVSLAVVAASFTGIGLLVRRVFGRSGVSLDDLFLDFWVGHAVTLLILLLWHFFFPIGLPVQVVVLTIGGVGLWLAVSTLREWLAGYPWRRHRATLVVAVLAAFWVVNRCYTSFDSWDGVLYHLQSVAWAKTYAVVPGIANLHGPLAFNNSSFLYDAMLDTGWWEGRAFYIANGSLLLVAFLQFSVAGQRWFSCRHRPVAARLFEFLMLPVAFLGSTQAVSYGTDLPAALLLCVAAAKTYRLLDPDPAPEGRGDSHAIVTLALLLAAAVSVKLTAATFAALLVPVAVGGWRSRLSGQAAFRRGLWWTGAIFLVFGGAWVCHGIVMSGYPLFPLSVGGLGVDWKAPLEHARAELANISYTEREFTWHIVGANWLRSLFVRETYAVIVPAALSAAAFWLYRRRRGRLGAATGSRTWWLLLPTLTAIAAWAATAPSFRYAPVLFWIFAALFVCEYYRVVHVETPKERWRKSVLVVAVVSLPVVQPALVAWTAGSSVWEATLKHFAPARPVGLPPFSGGAEVVVFRTESGLELNVPVKRTDTDEPGACGNAPLPCTPNPSPNLQLRVPGRLDGGFRVEGPWEMVDWPYYWRPSFLAEWRARTKATRRF